MDDDSKRALNSSDNETSFERFFAVFEAERQLRDALPQVKVVGDRITERVRGLVEKADEWSSTLEKIDDFKKGLYELVEDACEMREKLDRLKEKVDRFRETLEAEEINQFNQNVDKMAKDIDDLKTSVDEIKVMANALGRRADETRAFFHARTSNDTMNGFE